MIINTIINQNSKIIEVTAYFALLRLTSLTSILDILQQQIRAYFAVFGL